MLDIKKQTKYLKYLERKLVGGKKNHIILDRVWTKEFPDTAGVYVFFEKNKLVYVGETKSLNKRMADMLNTRNHTLRTKIGAFNFSKVPGYQKASSKKCFTPDIEKRVADHLKNKMQIAYVPVSLGRKELEEYMTDKYLTKYNSPSKRGKRK